MAKQFAGFTDQQKEVLARKMGFNGPMHKFGEFLQSDPAKAQKFSLYEEKAKSLVGNTAADGVPKFSTGGVVTPPSNTPPNPAFEDINQIGRSVAQSAGTQITAGMMQNPSSAVTPVQTTPIQVSANEMVDTNSGQVADRPNVQSSGAVTTSTAAEPTTTPAPQVSTSTSQSQIQSATQNMQAEQGTVSQNSQVTAATALPSSDATVQGQLTRLMQQFEGGATPPWAAGAIRNANAIMAQRGLGASSMAGSAVTQAAMESAISIAAQDAATFSQFEITNLNNRQQARLQNAQAFLQMDLANLDARQQTAIFKSQAIVQSLFTDQAAENASRQFNATSQSQTDQFFASLRTQVSTFNAAQQNAMGQFNVEQDNAIRMFNQQMNDARDQFNATNRLVIDQSNAEWRRSVTTANNATINEANRLNAQAATGFTTAAYNNIMQRERDMYAFAFQAAENAKDRASGITQTQMAANAQQRAATGQALGTLAGSLIGGIFDSFF